jgi:transposase
MSATFVTVDRNTPLLLPCDLRDWVPENDLVHFVIEAIEGMVLPELRVNHRGSGSAQYPPRMMLSLLIYCYANGVFGSRRIERATYRDIAVRYLTGDTHPDHDTIAKFRRENLKAVAACFVRALELAREMKVLKVGTVSTDGTHMRANASKHKNVTYERAGELVEQLEADVKELLGKAEEADQREENDGQGLPEEIARREALKAKLTQARQQIEERARQRAEAERAKYEAKVARREQRKGSAKGGQIKTPDATPRPEEQENLVDTDSRLMRKSKRSSYEQGYNAQAVVDAEGSQLVLATRVSRCAADQRELGKNIQSVSATVGRPARVLADSGYVCEEEVRVVQAQGIEVYVPTGAEAVQQRRRYEFRPESRRSEKKKEPVAEWLKEMKSKLESEEGRALYRLRKQTVEPVFGIIKHVMGFRQFLLRGLTKVEGEWALVNLAYNVKRLWTLLQTAVA